MFAAYLGRERERERERKRDERESVDGKKNGVTIEEETSIHWTRHDQEDRKTKPKTHTHTHNSK